MTSFDKALRLSGVVLALSLSLAALAVGWAATTRTTPTATAGWPGIYRENLLTGRAEFCGPTPGWARVVCIPVERTPAPRPPAG